MRYKKCSRCGKAVSDYMTDKKGVICFDCAKSDPQYREIAEYIDACVRMTEARIAREAENGKK